MKVAMVTVTYNDDYKFKEWCQWYDEYKSEIDLHIIVDNGSEQEYLNMVKEHFTESIIIERQNNGGSTAAYNDGLRVALEDKNIDAIFFLGNDLRMKPGSVKLLYDFLYSDEKLGMVAPLMLRKDSDIIEAYGIAVNRIGKTHFRYSGGKAKDIPQPSEYVDFVPGGCSFSKREFYEKVGFQDEALFMYGDEIDMYYRSKKVGYKQGVVRDAVVWHQHIRTPKLNTGPDWMAFISGRNRVYLIRKHRDFFSGSIYFIITTIVEFAAFIKHYGDKTIRRSEKYKFKGLLCGLKGNMDNSFLNE